MRITQEVQSLKARLENAQTIIPVLWRTRVLLGFPDWKPQAKGVLRYRDNGGYQHVMLQAEQTTLSLKARAGNHCRRSGLERARCERCRFPRSCSAQLYRSTVRKCHVCRRVRGLPIFDRGQAACSSVRRKTCALLKRELLLAATRQELERAVAVLSRRRQHWRFDSRCACSLAEPETNGEDAYRLGKTGLLELLDSSRTSTEIKLNHLELLVAEMRPNLIPDGIGLLAASLKICSNDKRAQRGQARA